MNNRGQIGQIITSFPSLIFIFVIMLFFVILSGLMGKDLADTSAEPMPIYADAPSVKEHIKTNLPEQSSGKHSLIDTFLKTIVTPESVEYSVEELIKKSCPKPMIQMGYRELYEFTFSSISSRGKFALVEAMGSTKLEQTPSSYTIFASNSEDLKESAVMPDKFHSIFSLDDKTIQRKTLCVRLNSHVTLYVLPEESK